MGIWETDENTAILFYTLNSKEPEKTMKTCVKCLLPENKVGVKLDADSVCNYCRYFENVKDVWTDYDNLKHQFEERIYKFKGKYKYDALVGLTGGKDGAYVLSKMVKDYDLNVLAITFDNGFLSDDVHSNIEYITKALDVPHVYYHPDWNIHKKLYRSALTEFGHVCIGCGLFSHMYAIKYCHENKIPFWIHGRDPYQMFRQFDEHSDDVYTTLIKSNYSDYSFEKNLEVYKTVENKLKTIIGHLLPDPEDQKRTFKEFILDSSQVTTEFVPDAIGYFVYHQYDEEFMRQYIKDTIGYVSPGSHSDCKIHDAVMDIFRKIHGVEFTAREIAVMIRHNVITKEQGQTMLSQITNDTKRIKEEMDYCASRLDYSYIDLEEIIENNRVKTNKIINT